MRNRFGRRLRSALGERLPRAETRDAGPSDRPGKSARDRFVVVSLGMSLLAGETFSRPLFFAHYLPWYETPAVSGRWGWHWTMNHFHPDEKDPHGRRSIASRQYPLLEPYDSNDPDLLECHVLLMKLAGVDGVVVDWYGTDDLHDYALLHRNTEHLFRHIRRAGLGFVLCYEDRSLGEAVRGGRLSPDEVGKHLGSLLQRLSEGWFQDPLYVKWKGRPVFLVFGPAYAEDSAWEEALACVSPRPVLLTLSERRAFAEGGFAWVPMGEREGGIVSPEKALAYLRAFAERAKTWDVAMTAAFPGFEDIYAEAKVRPSYGVLDAREGVTFSETLSVAVESGVPFVQLVTWNDYGEGTVVEPTVEAGYRYLEQIQAMRRRFEPSFCFGAEELRLPVTLYGLRKRFPHDEERGAVLDVAAEALLEGRVEEARKQLACFSP